MRSLVRIVAAITLWASLLAPSPAALAQATAADVHADAASVTIVGNRIILKRVPVVYGDNLDKTRLRDVTLELSGKVLNGVVNVARVVQEGPSQPLAIGFVPGTYINPADGCQFHVEGAGPAAGGRTNWNLTTVVNTCQTTVTSNTSLSWQTGPIAGHIDQRQIESGGCTVEGPAFAYGLVGAGNRYGFGEGNLAKVTRVNNGLSIEQNYTTDSSCRSVVGPIVLRFCPGDVCT